jgi:hypothetical protein
MKNNKWYIRVLQLVALIILLQCIIIRTHAQQFSNYDKSIDTIAVKEYKQILPIFGKKVVAMGFELPEPLGIAVNYMHFDQGLLLENVMVGFEGLNNSADPVNLDDFLHFEELSSVGNIVMVKPDFWLFPFMNVYGILGRVDVNTKTVLDQPIELTTNVQTSGYNYGFGTTVAVGLKQWWIAGNFNFTWTQLSNLDEPNFARVSSYRFGKAHDYGKHGKLTYWFGAMKQKWGKTTSGGFKLAEILGELPDATIPDKVRESENYQNLTPPQKGVVDPILDVIEEAGQGNREGYDNLLMTYSVDKAPDKPWNMIVGANYALTKHWYFQGEVGFINRTSIMAGVNYRFHL